MKKRLDALVDFVDEKKIVADIGSDHGITAIKIFEEKNPREVIATDISENSLEKLREKLRNNPDLKIKTRVTDGIRDLEDLGLENIVISGMGGYLIGEILEEGKKVGQACEKLILQANNSLAHLRKYLLANNYRIEDEVMVLEEGKYYTIIVSRPGKNQEAYDDLAYRYGKILIEKKDPVFKSYLDFRLDELEAIYKNIENIETESALARRRAIEEERLEIGGIKKCL